MITSILTGNYRAAGKTGIQTLLIAVATAITLVEGAAALAGGKGAGTAAIGNAENAALKTAAKEGGIVGRGGRFSELDSARRTGEVAHHIPQNAFNRTAGRSRADGPALGMTTEDHALTRSFAGRGNRTMRQDAGMPARDRMAHDIRDIRKQFGGKYDQGIHEMIDYAKTLPEYKR